MRTKLYTEPNLSPMTIYEAIEVVKILSHYSEEIVATEQEPLKITRSLVRQIKEKNPIDIFRLISLMHHRDIEDVAEDLREDDGIMTVTAISQGFQVNSLPDLINAGVMFGISNVRWNDGGASRTD